MMSYLTYLLARQVFIHKILTWKKSTLGKYENINNSDLDGMSLASFCQSKAVGHFIRQFPFLGKKSQQVIFVQNHLIWGQSAGENIWARDLSPPPPPPNKTGPIRLWLIIQVKCDCLLLPFSCKHVVLPMVFRPGYSAICLRPR